MPSLDRFSVSAEGTVSCPLRRKDMKLAECLSCGRLVEVDPGEPPQHLVCEARYAVTFLGLDDEA